MGFTPEELFATANNELRAQSKEWIIHTAEGCSVVAVLIATVAFAAAYTVPGGANEETGYPILLRHPFFVTFTVSDVLSLTFSLAAVVTFLSILSSPFRLQDFKQSLPNKLTLGFAFLFLSVCLMMVAFAATILLMIKNKEHWAKVLLYTCSFIPVGIFALSYFPIYITKSIARSCKKFSSKTGLLVPQCFVSLLKRIFCCSECLNDKSTSSSIPWASTVKSEWAVCEIVNLGHLTPCYQESVCLKLLQDSIDLNKDDALCWQMFIVIVVKMWVHEASLKESNCLSNFIFFKNTHDQFRLIVHIPGGGI